MLILKNATLLTMADDIPFTGDVSIDVQTGKIAAVGKDLSVGVGDTEYDCGGLYILPGVVDAHGHIGMWEDGLDFEGADGNESTDPVTPQLRAIDAVNPLDNCFREAREAGVTTVVTGPGSANVIGGTFVALKTYGRRIEDMILCEPLAMKVAFGENPKRVYSEQKSAPSTRMATAALLREALAKADIYRKKLEAAGDDLGERPEYDQKSEALLPVLRGEIPLKAHVHRADDIQTALRIAKEFGVDLTLDHCTEGYLMADILCEEQAKVIIGPIICERSKPELRNQTLQAPRLLHEAGVAFAIMSDHPVNPVQYLLTSAALAAREGLDEITALRAVTLHAAQITGLGGRIGSIEAGKDADLVAFDRFPLDIKAKVRFVYIDGRLVHEAGDMP